MSTRSPAAPLAPFIALIATAVLCPAVSVGHAQGVPNGPTAAKLAAIAPAAVRSKPAASAPRLQPVATPMAAPAPAPLRARPPATLPAPESAAFSPGLPDNPTVQVVNLAAGKSMMVDLPVDAREVTVTNPAVADALLRTRRRISLMGLSAGQTDAVFFDAAGRRILSFDIRVGRDASALADTIGRLLPGSRVRVESINDGLVLAGEVASAADADKVRRLAEHFVAKPEQVMNLLTITGRDQVMVKVRIVEMQRSIIKQLGFNLNAVTGQLGMPQYAFGNSPTFGVNGAFMGGASGGYSLNTTANPVANYPFSQLGSGAASLAQQAGIGLGDIPTVVGQFLSGTGALSAAQKTFSQTFLNGLIGSVQTQVTPNVSPTQAGVPYTVTAASAGINSGNIAQLEQAYLNGGSLTTDQRFWLNAFNQQLPAYYAAPNTLASNSTFVDRSNPANYVQRGTAGSPGLNQAQAMLQAFERVGLVRTLAEPNLTAVSGESAKFLAGGEFPVPIGEDATGRVTVEFKPYGVGLGFTPVVMSEGRISMKISTEVSELTTDGGFTLGSSSPTAGDAVRLNIPGLKVRRTETTVELPSGGAMMIAGLLQQQTKENIDSLPGMTNLPVLGALFRSRDYLSGETELVVIVTPYLVKPTSPDRLQTPVDGLQIASDAETNFYGKLNHTSNVAPAGVAAKPLQGPYGYVIE